MGCISELIHERNAQYKAEYDAVKKDPYYDKYVQQGKAAAGKYDAVKSIDNMAQKIGNDDFRPVGFQPGESKYDVYLNMTGDDRRAYFYYYGRDGKDAAKKYIDNLTAIKNEEVAAKEYADNKAFAKKHKILGAGKNIVGSMTSALSLPETVVQTVKNTDWDKVSAADIGTWVQSRMLKADIGNKLNEKFESDTDEMLWRNGLISDEEYNERRSRSKQKKEAREKIENFKLPTKGPIDTNAPLFSGARIAAATQEGITEDMGATGKFLTGVGLSVGNNIANYAAYGPYAPVMMSLQSAGNSAYEGAQRSTDGYAVLANSTLNGLAEYFGEKADLKSLQNVLKNPQSYSIRKRIAAQALNEVANESATETMDILADLYTMGDDAVYRKYYNERIKNGDSKAQAALSTAGAALGQIAQAGLAGGLSGGIMFGGGMVMNNAVDTAADSGIYNADINHPKHAVNAEGAYSVNAATSKRSQAPLSNEERTEINRVARVVGTKVKIAEQGKGTATGEKYEHGVVYLAENADDPMRTMFANKIMQHMKETAPETYDAYLKMAMDTLSSETGLSRMELWWQKKAQYAGQGIELSAANAE
ncbi:MAG: hypothetical protein J1F63_05920 [Oscillospiraceae bacterium]|nr:hypothetical protein [Oscillospiraceae bacterium]